MLKETSRSPFPVPSSPLRINKLICLICSRVKERSLHRIDVLSTRSRDTGYRSIPVDAGQMRVYADAYHGIGVHALNALAHHKHFPFGYARPARRVNKV